MTHLGCQPNRGNATLLGGLASGDDIWRNGREELDLTTGAKVAVVAGGLTYLGLRIWELIDVWTRPKVRRPAGRRSAGIMLIPTVVAQRAGIGVGGFF